MRPVPSMSRSSAKQFLAVLTLVVFLGEAFSAGRHPAAARPADPDDSLAYEPKSGYEAPPRSPGRLAPATGALIGVHSYRDRRAEPEEQGIYQLERALGRTYDIANKFFGSFDTIAKSGLTWIETWDVENGRIPMISWACGKSADINAGKLDDVIRKTAHALRDFGYELFLRHCWEMDGERKSKRSVVGSPDDFIPAWRRIHRIFEREGAANVVWVWAPNAAGFKKRDRITDGEPPAPYYYPGDDYVDWVATSGYNWGVSTRTRKPPDRWRHVWEIYDSFMVFARERKKPIMIAEYGAQERRRGEKADWMRATHQAFMDLPRTEECEWCGVFKDIAAVVYFDSDHKHGDWRINSSDESLAAYKEAVRRPWFNQIHTLGLPWTHATGGDSTGGGAPPEQAPPEDPSAR